MNNDKPEPSSNITFVCEEHESKPGKYAGQDPSTFLNKFVKLGFIAKRPKNKKEHMWVKVEKLGTQGTQLEGVLDNDPVYDVGYVCGDVVGFDIDEIEAIYDNDPIQ